MPSSASIDVVAALSLHDALPICQEGRQSGEHLRAYRGAVASEVKEALQHRGSSESHHQLPAKNPRIVDESREVLEVDAADVADLVDRKSTRLNSSHLGISYAVFCLYRRRRRSFPTRRSSDLSGRSSVRRAPPCVPWCRGL